VAFAATAGTTYYFEVAGYSPSSSGTLQLHLAGTVYLASSLIPTSRSPAVNTETTVYFAVANSGPSPAVGVSLDMVPAPPGSLEWQTLECADGSPIGSKGTSPFDVPPGATTCAILFFTPSATFNPQQVYIRAQALNAAAPPTPVTGLNTWLLSATPTQGPDLIALTTTTDFFRTQAEGCTGVSNFAVGAHNMGTDTTNVVVSAHTGAASLPLSFTLFEIDPLLPIIIGDPILDTFPAGANRSILVTVQFNGCIPFDPIHSRIYVVFTDQASGRILGGTSTAVSTNR
jgi:hypothetical protein